MLVVLAIVTRFPAVPVAVIAPVIVVVVYAVNLMLDKAANVALWNVFDPVIVTAPFEAAPLTDRSL